MQYDDEILVSRFKAGDNSALNELVKKWHGKFCAKALWITKDAEMSKDLAQDSWKVIIDKIQDLKQNNKFGAWALRIVYSKSFDALRNKNKERLQQARIKHELKIKQIPDTENVELRQQMLKSIESLSVEKQEIIKLFYLEDYTLKEISKILDISEGTVKSRLFHAREQLKKLLKKKVFI